MAKRDLCGLLLQTFSCTYIFITLLSSEAICIVMYALVKIIPPPVQVAVGGGTAWQVMCAW